MQTTSKSLSTRFTTGLWPLFLILLSSTVQARHESPLWPGHSAKLWAGATNLTAESSSALFYNPANIFTHNADILDYDLAILSLQYTYDYPGYDTVKIEKGTLLPYLGFSKQLAPDLFFAATFLPYPGSAEATEIRNLPTLEAGTVPILVDVEQKGPSLSWRSAFGLAWRQQKTHHFGFSFVYIRDGVDRTVTDSLGGLELQSEQRTNDVYDFNFGYKHIASDKTWELGLALIPYGFETRKSKKKTFSLFGDDIENRNDKEKRPMKINAAMIYHLESFSPLLEVGYTSWQSVSTYSHTEYDYFNTISYAMGVNYPIDRFSRFVAAVGRYPTHLGDGITQSRAADGEEVVGFKVGDLDAFNRTVFSIGYSQKQLMHEINYYLQWQSGKRSAFEDSRVYGDHSLSIIFIGAGGQWAI